MGSLFNILIPILAVFIIYKLFITLGKNGEDNQNRHNNKFYSINSKNNIIELPLVKKNINTKSDKLDLLKNFNNKIEMENFANADDSAIKNLQKILIDYPMFNYREFMDGAEIAYEMINLSFAQNDRKTLNKLVIKKVFDNFNKVMTLREKLGNRVNSRFIGFERVQLKKATIEKNIVRISVHFIAKLISTTYDRNDRIIEGDEKHIFSTNDLWIFENNSINENTSWKLIATVKC